MRKSSWNSVLHEGSHDCAASRSCCKGAHLSCASHNNGCPDRWRYWRLSVADVLQHAEIAYCDGAKIPPSRSWLPFADLTYQLKLGYKIMASSYKPFQRTFTLALSNVASVLLSPSPCYISDCENPLTSNVLADEPSCAVRGANCLPI